MEKAREITMTAAQSYRPRAKSEALIAVALLVPGDHDKALSILEAASKMDSPIFVNRELDLWFIFDRLPPSLERAMARQGGGIRALISCWRID